ncbi:acetyltransferase [Catalinimonas niigatensis]|uniref:acetyltransferase n=1 Tax=Catalinimonas niigatensis TaxID=1397264 RepID=UPI002665989B|nr:acetyltransferase [Catalinimonas niigatensis]WPP50307.1 acetyltransferase [Catalinimonas niigatensis]
MNKETQDNSTYTLEKGELKDFPEIVEVWEASVRATHHFLTEEDILYFKPLILNEYLDAVDLWVALDPQHKIVGFLGESEGNIEMLFIHPDHRGKGAGKLLLHHAIHELHAHKVDVNEQNEQAVGFYKQMGFVIVKRSEKDGLGKPYPILHMQLKPDQ